MTPTERTLAQLYPATHRYVADPWQDWKRHVARIRGRRMVKLWGGGRPTVLTMCGLLGQAGTDVRYAEDCAACHRACADEMSAAAEMLPLPLTREQKAAS